MPVFWGIVPAERPVRRDTLVRMQQNLPPHTWRRPDRPLVRAGVTGRGNDLLVLAWTAQMLSMERAAGVRFLQRAGVQRGHRVANTLPGALATPGSLLLGDVVEDIGALDIPLGAITSAQAAATAWELLRLVEPRVLVLETTSAATFFAAMPCQREWFLDTVVWLHREPPDTWPTLPENVRAKQTMHWLTVPEVQCFFAYSCDGGHFHVDECLGVRVVASAGSTDTASGLLEVAWDDPEQGTLSYLLPWAIKRDSQICPLTGQQAICLLESPPLCAAPS
ncbi:hypothetical protein HRbin30_03009 [bacterium HR30]|nr:hypothetical protein HRbin30_03009 [bacterium HR30]